MNHYFDWKLRQLLHQIRRQGLFATGHDFMIKIQQKKNLFTADPNPNLAKKQFINLWQQTQIPSGSTFRVLLVVFSYYDLTGEKFQQGGAERYTLELNQIVNQLGGRLEVYQCGDKNWHRNYGGIDFFGLATRGFNTEVLNQYFHEWVPQGRLTIYFQMTLSAPCYHKPSICISHGVDWDAHWLQNQPHRYKQIINTILSSIRNVSCMVSVDTNTINWLRATDAMLAHKCIYVPNFVDTVAFHPVDYPHDGFILLYPRRLSEARGFWLLAHIIPELMNKHLNLQVHFCGIAEHLEEIEVRHLCKSYPNRVLWYEKHPDDMPLVYAQADLVVVPTCYSEGTSLSCLEALASQRPVIASNVGGLTDLILHGFNGILIEPKEEELLHAIDGLLLNTDERMRLGKNGWLSAQYFSLSIWKERWRIILKKLLNDYPET
jgi:glycosyltransferase involved in cell wall biosynthesis